MAKAEYRVLAYRMGQGQICHCSTRSLASGQQDLRKLMKEPGRITAMLDVRDPKSSTGWREVRKQSNY
jgi:hypothetical protein